MQVDGGCLQVGVSKKGLYRANVGSIAKETGRGSMTERMRFDVVMSGKSGDGFDFFEEGTQSVVMYAAVAVIGEEVGMGTVFGTQGKPFTQGRESIGTEKDFAAFIAFAVANEQRAIGEIHVIKFEVETFGAAESGKDKDGKQGASEGDLLRIASAFARVEELTNLFIRNGFSVCGVFFGQSDFDGGVFREGIVCNEERAETAERVEEAANSARAQSLASQVIEEAAQGRDVESVERGIRVAVVSQPVLEVVEACLIGFDRGRRGSLLEAEEAQIIGDAVMECHGSISLCKCYFTGT